MSGRQQTLKLLNGPLAKRTLPKHSTRRWGCLCKATALLILASAINRNTQRLGRVAFAVTAQGGIGPPLTPESRIPSSPVPALALFA